MPGIEDEGGQDEPRFMPTMSNAAEEEDGGFDGPAHQTYL
jgi:hypothetical protein